MNDRLLLILMLLAAAVLPGCATVKPAAEGERIILVSKAQKTGFEISQNASSLPRAAPGMVGGSVGRVGANALDVGTALLVNAIGKDVRSLQIRGVNDKTCERVMYHANLSDERVLRMTAGDIAEWKRIGDERLLAAAPITRPDGSTEKIRRSHPCFQVWYKEFEIGWKCHDCVALINIDMSGKKPPALEWLED